MLLEVRRDVSRIIFYNGAKWFLKGNLLEESIPRCYSTTTSEISVFKSGDNIRLDGKPFYIDKIHIASNDKEILFSYTLKEGTWEIPSWLTVGEVESN